MTGPHDPADRPEDGPEITAEQAQRIIDADRPGGVPGDGPGV